MKFTIKIITRLVLALNLVSYAIQLESTGAAFLNNKVNQEKKSKDIKSPFGPHSLWHENDSKERMSFEYRAVPPPEQEKSSGKFPDTEHIIAKRLVTSYRKIFDFLDYKLPINDCVAPDELSIVYSDFHWPMKNADAEPFDYSTNVVEQYDASEKGCMNFVEFCGYMEGLWDVSDQVQMRNCGFAYDKTIATWQKLFDWLDRDNDKWITMEDMIHGISKVMYRDVNMDEIANVFKKYDPKKLDKINYQSFVLSIINGLLDETLKNPITPDIGSS